MLRSHETTLPVDADVRLAGFPVARTEGLTIEVVGDETVVFDCDVSHFHTLNAASVEVWRLCDGTRSAEMIASETGMFLESTRYAVASLGESGLLQGGTDGWNARMHRRTMLKVAAVAVLPMIASITADGQSALAATCLPQNSACTTSVECCNNPTVCCRVVGGQRQCKPGQGQCL